MSPEQEVGGGASVVVFGLVGSNTLGGGLASVESDACGGPGSIEGLEGGGQFVADFDFLFFECLVSFGESEFEVSDLGLSGSHSQRHIELHSGFPAIEVAIGEAAVGTAVGPVGLSEQVVAEAVDVVAEDDIELRSGEASCGAELQLQALDRPLLASQFDSSCQRVDQAGFPIGSVFGGDGFIGGSNDPAVVDGESDESSES